MATRKLLEKKFLKNLLKFRNEVNKNDKSSFKYATQIHKWN